MDEQTLVAALRGEDPGAAEELISLCGERLLRSAFLLCGNQTEARDLVQETFLQAIKSAHRFGGRARVYTWLHAILLNLIRHYHRTGKRLIYDEKAAASQICEPNSELQGSDIETANSALLKALDKLSPPHREILVLRYYEEMKIGEIAAHLGISKGTVKSRLHYAIEQMQKFMPDEMNPFGRSGTKREMGEQPSLINTTKTA